MNGTYCWIFLMAASGAFLEIAAVTRIWQPQMARFEEAATWRNERAPCFGDRVGLQENRAILVSQHHTLAGLTLPSSGELIFSEGAVLEIVDLSQSAYQQQDACPSKALDVPLIAKVNASSWFDARNWNAVSEGLERKEIFLDSERIPCNGDDVELPSGHTFQIDMPSTLKEAILLRSFKVGHLTLTDRTLAEYFSKPKSSPIFDAAFYMGLNQSGAERAISQTYVRDEETSTAGTFLKIGKENLARWPCDAEYGCKCGNDRKEVMEEICKFVEKSKTFPCQVPITIQGHCQPVCGSVVNVKVTSAATAVDTLRRVQSILDELRESDDGGLPTDVEEYTSILYDNTIQTVFIPSPSEKTKSESLIPAQGHQSAASLFHVRLSSETNRPWISSESLSILSSGAWQDGAQGKYVNASSSSSGIIAGVISGIVILVLVMLVAGWMIWRRRRQMPFSFRSFGQDDEPLEMEVGPNFVNPLYGPSDDTRHSLMDDDMNVINSQFTDFEDDDRAGLAENEF